MHLKYVVVTLLALALFAGLANADGADSPIVKTMRKRLADTDYQAMDGVTKTKVFIDVLKANSPALAAITEPATQYCAAFQLMDWLEKKKPLNIEACAMPDPDKVIERYKPQSPK